MNSTTGKRLTKSSTDRMIAGVCGGLAEYFAIDPTLVRVGYVVASIFVGGFPGLLAYIVLAVVIPER